MGYTNDEEPRASTPELEETLPLYEESQRDSAAEIELPDPKATPDEVRDFLVQVLQARGVGVDRARRVAGRWQLGLGEELSAYPVAMYRDIFGVEDAWVVYKEVKVRIYRKKAEEDRKGRKGLLIFIAILISLWAGAMAIATTVDSSFWTVASIFFMIFDGMAIMGGTIAVCSNTSPEDQVANELKSQWQQTPNTQSATS